MEARACKWCGAEFNAPDGRIKYCETCRAGKHTLYERVRAARVKAERGARRCKDCNAEIADPRGGALRCIPCREAAQKLANLESGRRWRLQHGAHQGIDLACQRCGRTFRAKRKDAKWCPPCKVITNGGRVNEFGESVDITLACQECGKPFNARRADARWCDACKVSVREMLANRAFEHRHQKPCMDCGALISRRGTRCKSCAARARNGGNTGERNPTWKGGRTQSNGYVFVRTRSGKNGGYRGEHIVVWEQAHGHPLPKGWVVHHLNGVKTDNRPENLAGMPRHHHHQHPRAALVPYEERIRLLEQALRDAGVGLPTAVSKPWSAEHPHAHDHEPNAN